MQKIINWQGQQRAVCSLGHGLSANCSPCRWAFCVRTVSAGKRAKEMAELQRDECAVRRDIHGYSRRNRFRLLGNVDKLEPEAKRWVRQYFDLYSEEYWLFLNERIPNAMWTRRIHGGVRVNLNMYPALVDGYRYWKAEGSFTHPVEFQAEVELAISDASKLPQKTKIASSCGLKVAQPGSAGDAAR